MGVYDSFYIKNFECPKCKTVYERVEFQSKDLRCCLDRYDLYDKVVDFDTNRHHYQRGIVKLFFFCNNVERLDGTRMPGCGLGCDYLGIIFEGRFIGITSKGPNDWDEEIVMLYRGYEEWRKKRS